LSIQEAKKAMVMDRVIRGEMTAAEGALYDKYASKSLHPYAMGFS